MATDIKNLKSGHLNEEEIAKRLTVDMMFERTDGTKIKIVNVDGDSVITNTLNMSGKEIDETRNFSRKMFAALIRTKHFEPTTFGRMETFSDVNRNHKLNLRKNFK